LYQGNLLVCQQCLYSKKQLQVDFGFDQTANSKAVADRHYVKPEEVLPDVRKAVNDAVFRPHRGSTAKDVVYVLHAFQKKSPTGIRTARPDVELVTKRLRMAQKYFEERHGEEKK